MKINERTHRGSSDLMGVNEESALSLMRRKDHLFNFTILTLSLIAFPSVGKSFSLSSLDTNTRATWSKGNPSALADRSVRLKSKLSSSDWHQVVRLWSRYLHAQADYLRADHLEEFCGAGESFSAMKFDYTLLSFFPISIAVGNPGGAVLAVEGPIGLGADIVFFVPNLVARGWHFLFIES